MIMYVYWQHSSFSYGDFIDTQVDVNFNISISIFTFEHEY